MAKVNKASKMSTMRDKIRKKAAERKQQNTGGRVLNIPSTFDIQYFKPEKTLYYLDFIPYKVTAAHHPDGLDVGDLWPVRTYWCHKNVGVEENTYICPLKTFGKPCPICEYARKLKDQGADKTEMAAYRPQERDLYLVIDTKSKEQEIMIWDVSSFLFSKMLDAEISEGEEDFASYAELKGGKTLKIRFSKESFQGKPFFKCERIDFIDRKEDYDDEIVDDIPSLDDCLVVLSYEKLEQVFVMGTAAKEDDDEDDEDEKPSRHKGAKGRTRPSVKEEDEDEEEEEEEDEKPSRSSKKRSRPVKEEEEEEDDDTEEDTPDDEDEEEPESEPEEKSSKRRGRPRKEEAEPEVEKKPAKRGRKTEPEPEPEEKPAKRRGKSAPAKEESKCKFGHVFGVDHDTCDSCEKECSIDDWEACQKASGDD